MTVRRLSALFLLLAAAGPLRAQSVDEILAKHAKAVDPEGKVASIAGMKMTAVLEMPAMGMTLTMTGLQRRPNQSTMSITIPGMGEMRQGYDGTMAWSEDPMQGPRIVTGLEAAAAVDGADFRAMIRPADLFTSSELAGEGEVDGQKCIKVKHTWKSARVTTDCYSTSTWLILESTGKQSSPNGDVETVQRFSDFRAEGGIVMAHKAVNTMMNMQQIMTITSIEFGEQPAAAFEPPPAVKALKKP